ncbi:MAG: stalk domain-containing protein [Tissierellia bacterium]|nr:stalk domain-containing protein [Tissierellia bacterium]
MKKIVSILLAMTMVFVLVSSVKAEAVTGSKSFQKVILDGEEVQISSYLIAERNYFKMRDLAALLNGTCAQFNIQYNKEKKRVEIYKHQPYEKQAGDLAPLEEGAVSGELSVQGIYVDAATYRVQTALINQNNYVKLRDVAKILGFEVDYDKETKAIVIKTSKEKGLCGF